MSVSSVDQLLAKPRLGAVAIFNDGKEETRHRIEAVAECPKCGGKVYLISETDERVRGRGGIMRHFGYGPATGACCGLLIVDMPYGCDTYVLEEQ